MSSRIWGESRFEYFVGVSLAQENAEGEYIIFKDGRPEKLEQSYFQDIALSAVLS